MRHCDYCGADTELAKCPNCGGITPFASDNIPPADKSTANHPANHYSADHRPAKHSVFVRAIPIGGSGLYKLSEPIEFNYGTDDNLRGKTTYVAIGADWNGVQLVHPASADGNILSRVPIAKYGNVPKDVALIRLGFPPDHTI